MGLGTPLNGDPVAGVSAPVMGSNLKTETSLLALLATKTRFALETTASPLGCEPAGKGEPLIAVNVPLMPSMVNAETSLEFEFATKRNLPAASVAMNSGAMPAAKGLPAT